MNLVVICVVCCLVCLVWCWGLVKWVLCGWVLWLGSEKFFECLVGNGWVMMFIEIGNIM